MHRFWRTSLAGVAAWLLTTGAAMATSHTTVNPGQKIGDWVYTNVAALFAPLLAVMALYYLAKRQFTQFLSFAIFAVIAALFIFAGTEFKDAAVGLAKWIIGK